MNINKLAGNFELIYITSVDKACFCDNCTAYIQNIAVIKRIDANSNKTYKVGLDCCKKLTFGNSRSVKLKIKIWNACQRFARAFESGGKPEVLAFGVIQIVDFANKTIVRVDYQDLLIAFPNIQLPKEVLDRI